MSVEPSVVELHVGCRPEAAVSGGVLLQTEGPGALLFNAYRLNPDGALGASCFAVLSFPGLWVTKFGHPNDEALPGHPLWQRGLSAVRTGIAEVINSPWLAEHIAINRVKFPKTDDAGRHFIVSFHDATFECLAGDLRCEIFEIFDEAWLTIRRRADAAWVEARRRADI